MLPDTAARGSLQRRLPPRQQLRGFGVNAADIIVLTAARADRTSFGSSNGYQFTFYDHCFLASVNRGAAWAAIAHRIRACVERREAQVNAIASFPQTFFGARIAGLTAF